MVATLDPALLNAKSFVKVKPSLQLASESYPNIFAAGDVNDIAVRCATLPSCFSAVAHSPLPVLPMRVQEIKQAAFANFQAAVVAANILTLVKNPTKPSSALKEYKAAAPLALVTVGPDGGAGQLFGWVVGVSSWLSLSGARIVVARVRWDCES